MSEFRLPDLGEGLQEAEIVAWHVRVGEQIAVDQPLVSVETDKAVVDVPSPHAGEVTALHGAPGTIVQIGDLLVEFAGDSEPAASPDAKSDSGTVVGAVEVGDALVSEPASPVGRAPVGIKATPAVRALAKRLGVELSIVRPSGAEGQLTRADIERAARVLDESGAMEPLRGTRRAMARNMSFAHAEVAPVTIHEDADIDGWNAGADLTLRLLRALVAGCRAEPALNAWYDSQAVGRRLLERIDIGIAVDTREGLFVPVLRDAGGHDAEGLRAEVERLKQAVSERTIQPAEMRGYSIILSNYGTIAGRYASPIVQPPSVAILGAGRARPQVVAADGAPAVHRVLPLSLTFDHRAVTGGEAARFLAAVLADLEGAA